MEYLISVIWIVFDTIYVLLFSFAFLKPLRAVREILIATILVSLAIFGINNLGIQSFVRLAMVVAIYYIMVYFLFAGTVSIRLFLVMISYLFLCIIDTVVAFGISALLEISLSELMWRKITYSATVSIGKLLALFIGWLLCQYRRTKEFDRISGKWFALTLLFPSVSFAILAVYFYSNQGNEDISFSAVIMGSILAIANVGILYLIYALEKATAKEQEMLLMKQQMLFQAESYIALEKNYRIQRKATHEFEHHLITIKNLLSLSDYETANIYIKHLIKDRSSHLIAVNSRHPIIDVILNEKYREAKEKSIKMQIQVNDLSNISIQSDDIVVLLSNLLDNALEASENCDENREICCSILHDDSLYISIRNTSKPVEIIQGKIQTSKNNKNNHGFGLPAIKYILDKLEAEYTFEYSEGWFQFVSEIPL